jgi:hypothetical protein
MGIPIRQQRIPAPDHAQKMAGDSQSQPKVV